MATYNQIHQIFKYNISSFGLDYAAKILNVNPASLRNLLKNEGIGNNNLMLQYCIKLKEHSRIK
jgi:hypothetical protein